MSTLGYNIYLAVMRPDRMRTLFVLFILLLIVAPVSFYYGAKFGIEQYILAMSAGNAFNYSRQIRILRTMNADTLIPELESNMESELGLYKQFQQHGYPIILWPNLHNIDQESYIRKLKENVVGNDYANMPN